MGGLVGENTADEEKERGFVVFLRRSTAVQPQCVVHIQRMHNNHQAGFTQRSILIKVWEKAVTFAWTTTEIYLLQSM